MENKMEFREALVSDIKQMQVVRHLVKENTLSNPALVTDRDYEAFITQRGKGWVCINNNRLLGFSIVDLQGKNVWALFVDPEQEERGIGKKLHRLMIDWYFTQTSETIWLGTAPTTRAEEFYARQGWKKTGMVNKGEVKFEMSFARWKQRKLQGKGK